MNELMQGGLGAGELGVVVAPAGIGKSWVLSAMGAYAISQGLNVVHYTLELNEAYVGLRYDSIFTGIAMLLAMISVLTLLPSLILLIAWSILEISFICLLRAFISTFLSVYELAWSTMSAETLLSSKEPLYKASLLALTNSFFHSVNLILKNTLCFSHIYFSVSFGT